MELSQTAGASQPDPFHKGAVVSVPAMTKSAPEASPQIDLNYIATRQQLTTAANKLYSSAVQARHKLFHLG